MNTHAVSLNGSNQYLNDADNFWRPTAFTFECWVKPSSLSGNPRVISLVNADVDFTLASNGTLLLEIRHSSGIESIASSSTISTGDWSHIAVTYNAVSKAYAFYINGVVSGSGVSSNSLAYQGSNTVGITVGARGGPSSYYNGLIDDVRLWSTVRTSLQITSNRLTELIGNETGLYAYWKLNNDYEDSGPNNYDLTPIGSPTVTTDIPSGFESASLSPSSSPSPSMSRSFSPSASISPSSSGSTSASPSSSTSPSPSASNVETLSIDLVEICFSTSYRDKYRRC